MFVQRCLIVWTRLRLSKSLFSGILGIYLDYLLMSAFSDSSSLGMNSPLSRPTSAETSDIK